MREKYTCVLTVRHQKIVPYRYYLLRRGKMVKKLTFLSGGGKTDANGLQGLFLNCFVLHLPGLSAYSDGFYLRRVALFMTGGDDLPRSE
jgi:hypothetical protein